MTALIIPVWCQNADTLHMFLSAAETWRQQSPLRVYAPTNRLHQIKPEELQAQLADKSGQEVRVMHEDGVERSVAGAWNHALRAAEADGLTDFVVTAMDVFWHPYAIDRLVKIGRSHDDAIISGVEERVARGEELTEGADFSGLYLSSVTRAKFGEFFEGYRPAYFEDNDFAAQVWKHGGDIWQTHAARFFHHGSGTIKTDAEAAHHTKHWFGLNKRLFVERWGSEPVGTKEEALARYRMK